MSAELEARAVALSAALRDAVPPGELLLERLGPTLEEIRAFAANLLSHTSSGNVVTRSLLIATEGLMQATYSVSPAVQTGVFQAEDADRAAVRDAAERLRAAGSALTAALETGYRALFARGDEP